LGFLWKEIPLRRRRSSGLLSMDSNLIVTEVINDQQSFESLIEDLLNFEVFAIDTEFHREKTYYPKLALLQLRWGERLAILDPVSVDVSKLSLIFETNSLAVFHAGAQDLEVLSRATGTVPSNIFDTQIAAGFLGMRTPSLSSLHENLLGLKIPKGDRLTNWFQRPLTESQLQYAASDVRHLLDLYNELKEQLNELDRLSWASAEFQTFSEKRVRSIEPSEAWHRIKEAKHLNKNSRGVAQVLAEWRELTAQKNDIPNRFIMSDLALVGVAQKKPKNLNDLKNIRGLDASHSKGEKGKQLLKIVERGLNTETPPVLKNQKKSLKPEMRPAVTLLSAWLSQFATDKKIDPALLGSRSDIEELLRGENRSKLQTGWRRDQIGEQINDLLDGRSSLSFEDGRLVIENRGTHS